jgi:hypothetical protein
MNLAKVNHQSWKFGHKKKKKQKIFGCAHGDHAHVNRAHVTMSTSQVAALLMVTMSTM